MTRIPRTDRPSSQPSPRLCCTASNDASVTRPNHPGDSLSAGHRPRHRGGPSRLNGHSGGTSLAMEQCERPPTSPGGGAHEHDRFHPRRRDRLVEGRRTALANRSEEHTSELQSRFDLVCRLLLETKNSQAHIVTTL